MADLRLSGRLARAVPQGAAPGTDPTPATLGRIFAVDPDGARVQVRVRSEAVWLPATAARYQVGWPALIVWDVVAGRPMWVTGTTNPAAPTSLARVTAASGTTITVTWNDVAKPLPGIPGTYTVGQTAWVQTDDWGRPIVVLGPSSVPPPPTPVDPDPTPTPPPTPQPSFVQVTTTLSAQWSGSWRGSRGDWNSWNVGRYGWPSTMWQGNGRSSGPMTGLATFGDLFTNLGATSIDAVAISAARNDGEYGARTLALRPSPHGSQPGGAPAGFGGTYSGNAAASPIWLDAGAREDLRTGAARGFITAGSDYSGWVSLSARVTYTRPA